MWFSSSCLWLIGVIAAVSGDSIMHDVSVKFQNGELLGHRVLTNELNTVDQYLSIRYAKPPTGDLRFKPPVPSDPITEKVNVTAKAPSCSQVKAADFYNNSVKEQTSEDCLYLSVYTPSESRESLPVLVIIHPGGFEEGSISDTNLAMNIVGNFKVIVVRMQYRLRALGFLYLDDADAPGNMGLLDQQLAMKWVKDNIAAFGGNSDSITLVGCSAGGISVSLQMLSPNSQGLFHRAIISSGSAISVGVYHSPEKTLQLSQKLISILSCDKGSIKESLECLRGKDAIDIVKAERTIEHIGRFRPTTDGHFIQHPPKYYYENDLVYRIPVLHGVARSEGEFMIWRLKPDFIQPNPPEIPEEALDFVIRIASKFSDDKIKSMKHLQRSIIREEMGVDPDNLDILRTIVGNGMTCGIVHAINYYATHLPEQTFMYVFDYKTKSMSLPHWVKPTHAGDWTMVFERYCVGNDCRDPEEHELQMRFLTSWINFAVSGNPNIDTQGNRASNEWKPVGKGEKRIHQIIDDKSTWEHGDNFQWKSCELLSCLGWVDNLPLIKQGCEKYTEIVRHFKGDGIQKDEL